MRKFVKSVAAFLCAVSLLGAMSFPAAAEAKAGEGDSGVLVYQPENLSWNGEEITVTGSFVNMSADKDITAVNSATFSVFDASDKKITETTLNSSSLGEVKLAPGEKWSYTIVRTVSGFKPENFNISAGFKTGCSTDITIGSHGSGCSFCSSRGSLTFRTEDTMSQEELQNLVAKLKVALGKDDSSAAAGGGSGAGNYVPYVPDTSTSGKQQKTCSTCGGAGSLICEKCNGIGYKTRQERQTCLVAHHADCPAIRGKGGRCNDCHERHDIKTGKDTCLWCNGSGRTTCRTCHGRGTVSY